MRFRRSLELMLGIVRVDLQADRESVLPAKEPGSSCSGFVSSGGASPRSIQSLISRACSARC